MVIAQKVDVCRLNAHLLVDFQLQNEKNLNNEVSTRVPQAWFNNGRIGELNRHGARSLPWTTFICCRDIEARSTNPAQCFVYRGTVEAAGHTSSFCSSASAAVAERASIK